MAPANRKNPKRSSASDSRYSLVEFMRDFSDDEACLQWLWQTRFETSEPGHAHCEICGEIRPFKRYHTTQQRQSWTCTACGRHVHPTAGTIFHKSSTSLHLWFYAMYLMTSTRCGISAKQLERELGVTYKTAWRMFNLIRNELMSSDARPLTGTVEMDETYVGGKPRLSDQRTWANQNRHVAAARWTAQNKTMVFGMVERSREADLGRVVAHVVLRRSPQAIVYNHISTGVIPGTTLITDDAALYHGLKRKIAYVHFTINHRERIYVSGDIHTQQIEGFWSLVKRGISGTYHSVSVKWLQSYVDEYAWRYNHRGDERAMFKEMILRAAAG